MGSSAYRYTQILAELRKIDSRLFEIEKRTQPQPISIPESTFLNLPDHLRKTYITLAELGKATASDISLKTSKSRAIESSYCNQLIHMGLVKKYKDSRYTYFMLTNKKVR